MYWSNQEKRFIEVVTSWVRLNVHAKVEDHSHNQTVPEFLVWALSVPSANKVWTQTHLSALRKESIDPARYDEIMAEAARRVVRSDFKHRTFDGLSLAVKKHTIVFIASDTKK